MYLKQVAIENSGPLRRVTLDLAVTGDGLPKPLVLVGTNGGGKTNFLSLVTDALFEAAAVHYQDVLPAKGIGRAWFRVVGGRTITMGAQGGFSLLRFEDAGQSITHKEKAGTLDPAQAAQRLPEELQDAAQWQTEGSFKEIDISDEQSRRMFEEGVYAYFPSSRSEFPFWLNRESIPETEFDVFIPLANQLRKPILVEHGLHAFKQWLIAVILESRVGALGGTSALDQCNLVLRKVLDDNDVRFVWLGRKNSDKVAIAKGGDVFLPNLDALSGGQSILLTLFGTLLRYGDQSQSGAALNLATIQGICVVDEIDSHIHVDLQHRVLPSLIRLFPRIQFIVSSHSPLFVLGMEKEFGAEEFQLVEMPGGNIVTAETFSEFGKAMEAMAATEAFNEKLLSEAAQTGVPIVLVEGETDTPYLQRAAEILQRADLLERCELQWIGGKDESGQGFHTGKGALDHTLALLRANPKLTQRPILLLYDNDSNKPDADYEAVSVRRMPVNPANTVVCSGIENLLPETSITDDDRQEVRSSKTNGDVIIRRTLRKMDLCRRICDSGDEGDFRGFAPALEIISAYLDLVAPLLPQQPGSNAQEA